MTQLVERAKFNPNIKNYIFATGILLMTLSIIGIPFIVIWILGYGQYVSKRYYDSLVCNLTEKQLQFKKGIFWRVEKTIPLENIQDLSFIETPLLRWFNLRFIKIETAGSSNPQGGGDMRLVGIEDAEAFKDRVLAQRERLMEGKMSRAAISGSVSADGEVVELLREIRDLLKK